MSEVLVVASKVKNYIKEKGDCNTSGETITALSSTIEKILEGAIQSAKAQGRKTVMARDVNSEDDS
ncbi:hypothetical protein GW915_07550 [bacterium]|nr:hypothetical protein [bacterium]